MNQISRRHERLFRVLLAVGIFFSILFWTLALLHSQGIKSTLLLVLGPQSRVAKAPTPFRILAVDSTFKRRKAILRGEVKLGEEQTISTSMEGFDVPANRPAGKVEVRVQTRTGPAMVVVDIPKVGQKKDIELVAERWQNEQTQRPASGSAAIYPLHGSARSSLQTTALVVDEEQGRLYLEPLKTHVIWTELRDGSRLRASRIRQIIQLSTLQVQGEIRGSILSEENESAYLDFYVDGRLRKMTRLELVKGKTTFQIPTLDWGPQPIDGLLVMRLTTGFAQKEAGALAFARVNPSTTELLSWAKKMFLERGGAKDAPLLRALTSSVDLKNQFGLSESQVVQALLARLNAIKWRPRTCSPSLEEQERELESRRQRVVKSQQTRFRIAAAFSCILLFTHQLLSLFYRKKERRRYLLEAGESQFVDDKVEIEETLSALKTAKGAERWLAFGITTAAFGMLGILDWVLTALAAGEIAF